MMIRKAMMSDTEAIYELIELYARKGVLLHRTRTSIYENLQSLYVAVEEDEVVGVAGLHILGFDLAEIRSLVVLPSSMGNGIGKKLVERIIQETAKLQIDKLISLTYEVTFFQKCGFRVVEKETLPQKVWKDCINCSKFPVCDEIAMLINVLDPVVVK